MDGETIIFTDTFSVGRPQARCIGSVICYHWLMEGPIEGTKHPAIIRVNGLEVPLSYTGRLPT